MFLGRITIPLLVAVLAASPSFSKPAPEEHEQIALQEGCDKNQTNMNTCAFYDRRVLEAELNELYKQQLTRVAGTVHMKRLIAAQRAWLKYVETDCLYQVGPVAESGTMWSLEQNSCKSGHFTQRVELLKSFLSCTQNGCPGQ